jgi:DNA polymerase II large subunit
MDDEDYLRVLQERLGTARDIANDARADRFDPKPFVEMEFAKDLAGRCEKLLMIDGLAERIHAYEEQSFSREEIAIKLADDFADGHIGSYDSEEEMVDAAIRTAVALLTEGVVAAPIDGIGEITIETNDDGSQFVRIPYFGPIRSAGGTGQALSILVADHIRQRLDIGAFDPREDEVERYVEEIQLYDQEISMQYKPKDKEVRTILENCAIMIDGPGTTQGEVEGYRDLDRIDGNNARGGMCLVLGEGIAQKAPKIQRYTGDLDIDGWGWLDGLSTVTTDEEPDSTEQTEPDTDTTPTEFDGTYDKTNDALEPSSKFIEDLIAGRPVFSDPSATGGFRLRYGRARNMGLAACGYSPATMVVFDEFLATGTQLKTERPGKAAGVSPVDSLEGPTVRLSNGELRRIDDVDEAYRLLNAIEQIVDVGEVAIPYGEFLENNHPLVPASYVHEWWAQEYEAATGQAAPDQASLTAEEAFSIAQAQDIPLHPAYTFHWDDIDTDQYSTLSTAVAETGSPMILDEQHKETLETLLVPHSWEQAESRLVIEDEDVQLTLRRCCTTGPATGDVRERVQSAAGVTVRERSPVRVGARMGRPEKSKRRESTPHALFPIGDTGGSLRDIQTAADHYADADDTSFFGSKNRDAPSENKRGVAREGERNAEGLIHTTLATRECPVCQESMWSPRCPDCAVRTEAEFTCPECGDHGAEDETCGRCDREYTAYDRQPFSVKDGLGRAMATVDVRSTEFDTMKGVKGLASKSKIPEPLEKGLLRAKHGLKVFRDGTARYDMMDLPLTSFRADDISTDVASLRELGYTETVDGAPLERADQLVEIFPQDIVLSTDCGEYMLQVANFVDELLVEYYDCEPYYQAEEIDDLVGELILGLAPHTSAGVLGRIVGFNPASANFASPFYHAGKRRNADGDEDCVMLLMDGLLNFSKEFLPDRRGKSTMDAPLVVSTVLDPLEVDDEAHNVDIAGEYPLAFYEATYEMESPETFEMPIAEQLTDTGMGFDHSLETASISAGPTESRYKKDLDMQEKTTAQLVLADKTRAVDETAVAEMVIEKHFMPDIIGNLSAFARQKFRCPKCNEKYRRVPLGSNCRECGGDNIILTVHEGSVKKYIDIVTDISEEYEVTEYTVQRIESLSNRIDALFDDDKNKQTVLSNFL